MPDQINVPDQVLVEIYPDGAVLLDAETGLCYGLDQVGRDFWLALELGSLSSAHAQLCDLFDADPEVIRSDLRRFSARLVDLGFLTLS